MEERAAQAAADAATQGGFMGRHRSDPEIWWPAGIRARVYAAAGTVNPPHPHWE